VAERVRLVFFGLNFQKKMKGTNESFFFWLRLKKKKMSGSAKDSQTVLLISSVVAGFDGETKELCAILYLLVLAEEYKTGWLKFEL